MKAVLLAAGKGKRLRPITLTIPKYLIPIANTNLLKRNIENISGSGVNEIILIVNYLKEKVVNYIKKANFKAEITTVEQKKPLGTADALRYAADLIKDDYFLLLYADILVTQENLHEFINRSLKIGVPSIATVKVNDPSRYGICKSRDGVLESIVEKPNKYIGNLANAGLYTLPKETFEYIDKTPLSPRKEYEITDTINIMIKKGVRIRVYRIRGNWVDVGTPENLLKAQRMIFNELKINAYRYIHPAANVSNQSSIGPFTTIGERCLISRDSQIEDSIILDRAEIGGESYITGAVICEDVKVGEKSTIRGTLKNPVIIGQGVKIGNDSKISSGTIIYPTS